MAIFLHIAADSCKQNTNPGFLAFVIDGCYCDIEIDERHQTIASRTSNVLSLGKLSSFTIRCWIHSCAQRFDFFTCFFDGSADLNDRFFDKILQFGGLHDLESKFLLLKCSTLFTSPAPFPTPPPSSRAPDR